VVVRQSIHGDKAWMSVSGEKQELEGALLADAREELQAIWYNRLYPLLDETKVTLAPLAGTKVDGKDTVGVRVKAEGGKEFDLYFDYSNKKVGLLLKTVRKGYDPAADKKDAVRETLYGDYKVEDGAQYPGKIVLYVDGKKTVDVEVTELKPVKNLDDKEFTEP
jgi:hypothetical protein